MDIKVSETITKHLMRQYPQLTEEIIKGLFIRHGKVERRFLNLCRVNRYEYIRKSYFVLIIPEEIADELGIDEELDLTLDKEGVIYKIFQ